MDEKEKEAGKTYPSCPIDFSPVFPENPEFVPEEDPSSSGNFSGNPADIFCASVHGGGKKLFRLSFPGLSLDCSSR